MPPRPSLSGSKRRRPGSGNRGSDSAASGRRKGGGGGRGLKDSFLVEAASSEDELEESKGDSELQDMMIEGRSQLRRGRGQPGDSDDEDGGQEEVRETAQQKRVRLAKAYLRKLELDKKPVDGEGSDGEDGDAVGLELREQEDRRRGVIHKSVAASFRANTDDPDAEPPVSACMLMRGHKLSVTSIAVAKQRPVAFSGSKDGTVLQWDVETGKKLHLYARGHRNSKVGHTDEVLSLAVTSDGNQLISGGRDRTIRVWDTRSCQQVDVFTGHKEAVTCLALQTDDDNLYSGSLDRTVRVWSMRQMAFVETLFGHHGQVMSLDSLLQDRAVSCGADKTVRLWKVSEQKQLMYRGGHEASIDSIRMVSDKVYVTGSQDGGLALWADTKRKPIARRANAHGSNWICSVAALPYGDVLVSGSSDGAVRFWDCLPGDNANRGARITALSHAPVVGFVNALQFSEDSRLVFCGVGQEHRMGRWGKIQEARNGIHVLRRAAE